MNYNIKRTIKSLEKKEERIIANARSVNPLKEKLYTKVPDKLRITLESAFGKAFHIVFLHGTSVIEKAFNKEDKLLEHYSNNLLVENKSNRQNIKRIDNSTKRSKLANNVFTTACGFGLGVLGIGIPDIPIFIGTILGGIYQTALSYGVSYESDEEKIYILRLIRTALAYDDNKKLFNDELDSCDYNNSTLEEEIQLTSKVLADVLLVEKFIQGIPVVGAVGGLVNNSVYRKIQKFSTIKYKKRYLKSKA